MKKTKSFLTVICLILSGILINSLSSYSINTYVFKDTLLSQKGSEEDSPDSIEPDSCQWKSPSAVTLTKKDFNKGTFVSVMDLLQARVPGLSLSRINGYPGSDYNFNIRGASTTSGLNLPLFVIDGAVYDEENFYTENNALLYLNSNDIESITVLKDGADVTRYGSRGANGVILINTKKPSQNESFQLSYKGEMSLNTNPSSIPVMGANKFESLVRERYPNNDTVLNLLGNTNTPWQDKIFRQGIGHKHYLGVSGHLKSISLPFRASIGFDDQQGTLNTTNLSRTTASLRFTPSFFDNHLKTDINMRGLYMDSHNPLQYHYGSPRNVNSLQHALMFNPTQPVYSEYDRNSNAYFVDLPRNPKRFNEVTAEIKQGHRAYFNLGLNYQIHSIPELTANVQYSYMDRKTQRIDRRWSSNHSQNMSLSKDTTQQSDQFFRGSLTYSESFAAINSDINFKAGYENQIITNHQYSFLPELEDEEYTYSSVFAQLNYDLKNRYFLQMAFSRDWNSVFYGTESYANYPGGSLSWRMDREPFFNSDGLINQFKLYASYGASGRLATNFLFMYDNDANKGYPKTSSLSAGLTFSMLSNRIAGSFNWYQRETDRFANYLTVINRTVINKGVELNLNGYPLRQKDLQWHAGINLTANTNKIESLKNESRSETSLTYGAIKGGGLNADVLILNPGHAIDSYYLYEQKYDNNGEPIEGEYVDQNGDGVINIEDRHISQNVSPDLVLGFYSDFNYKDFEFSFAGRIWSGNHVYNNVGSYHSSYTNLYHEDGYLQNLTANYQHFDQRQVFSNHYLEDASFLKIDRLTIGYDLKNLYTGKMNLKIYGSIQNVFTITDYKGLDPEVPSGVDYLQYPRPRVFRVGVKADIL
ncbi:MAG: SusC/RagA family TonB-linked outer membrane protein [Bacteroidales bacterium]|nr:SusC/RagA family TonB-linked outer membrane protein [Bacteroidales bacterium]MCF8336441.1 SusC/RagA family TonB-linked outer membrane protein [Bacteroidales bacterium]